MQRTITFLSLVLFSSVAAAQTANLQFEGPGARKVWVAPSVGHPPDDAKDANEATATVDLAGHRGTESLYVLDSDSGNLAVVPVAKAKSGTVSLKAADFNLVGRVEIKVTSAGKPVAAANLAFVPLKNPVGEMLDPSAKGVAVFFGVAPGPVKVTVRYRSNGATADPVRQEFDLALKRSEPVASFAISVPLPTDTVAEDGTSVPPVAADGSAPAKPAGAAPSTGSSAGTIVSMVIGLAVVGAVVFMALRYAKENPALVSSKLEQLGVQIPKPGDADLTTGDPVQVTPSAPAPPQKIILDAASPDPIAPISVAAPVVSGEPKLVTAGGEAVFLSEGQTVVGREAGLGLSLTEETTISRRHAELNRTGSTVVLVDLGSTNGTYVNGAKVAGQVPLQPGDQVQFGAVRFRFEG